MSMKAFFTRRILPLSLVLAVCVNANSTPFQYFVLNPQTQQATLHVMSLSNSNVIRFGDDALPLQMYQLGFVPSNEIGPGLEISGTGPFVLGSEADGSDLPVPGSFAGNNFVIPHFRFGHRYYIGSPFGPAQVRVQVGALVTVLNLAKGEVRAFDAGAETRVSGLLESDRPIVVAHLGWDARYSQAIDAYPVPPADTELWGIATLSPTLGALEDNTSVEVYSSEGTMTSLVLDRGQAVTLARDVGHGEGAALHLVADKPIAAAQVADGDGRESTAFLGEAYLGTRFGLPVDSQYVAVVCPSPETIVTLFRPNDGTSDVNNETRDCSAAGNQPGKAYFGLDASGVNVSSTAYLESSQPVYLIYETTATEDEHNLIGRRDVYFVLNPQTQNMPLQVMSLVENNHIHAGGRHLVLDRYQTGRISEVTSGLEISGTGPFVLGSEADGSDLPVPGSFAGNNFVIPHFRFGHRYYIGSPFGPAQVRVQVGALVTVLNLAKGEVRAFDAGAETRVSGLLESDRPIVVAHLGWDARYSQAIDAYPVPPADTELWGIATLSPTLGALEDNTSVEVYSSEGTMTSLVLDRGQAVTLARDVGHGEGAALHLVADKPIAAAQVADGDGRESTAFLGEAYLGTRFGLPVDSQYVAVVCTEPSTVVSLTRVDGTQESMNCSAAGDQPAKAYFGYGASGANLLAGARLESSKPVYVMHESSARNDEHNLLGASDDRGPNILVIIADDVGVDQLGIYAEHGASATIAPTPSINALAADGVLFRNVWSNPLCSPTRATIQSGRYSYRTGVGWITLKNGTSELHLDELLLPEVLDNNSRLGYEHAAIGKWNLSNDDNGGNDGVTMAGYSFYSGAFANLDYQSYYSWDKITSTRDDSGQITTSVSREATYATTANVNDALDWLQRLNEDQPWFLWLAFNAPHTPFSAPPTELHTFDDRGITPSSQYWPMLEAMDTEIGRLLSSLPPLERARTTVFFLGDNGTPVSVPPEPPFNPTRAKGTLYEGGINVPLIISGARIVNPNRESDVLVNTTDLFATILELAGINLEHSIPETFPNGAAREIDSTSLLPVLSANGLGARRQNAYAELFKADRALKTVRGARYKLLRFDSRADEMYDLASDPFEEINLLPLNPGDPLEPVFQELDEYLDQSGVF